MKRDFTHIKTNGFGRIVELAGTTRWNDSTPSKELVAGDTLVLDEGDAARPGYNMIRTYTINSVVSYALQSHDDPLAEIERAKERGHKMHWINACAASISSNPQTPDKDVIIVRLGDRIRFEGRAFIIVAAPNKNLDLREEAMAALGG